MDIGLQEILLISVLALIVLGPERLPTAIKTIAVWVNRFRRSFNEVKLAVEKEINADEIRQQIHNENVLHELGETRKALDEFEEQLKQDLVKDPDSDTNHPHNKQQHASTSSEKESNA